MVEKILRVLFSGLVGWIVFALIYFYPMIMTYKALSSKETMIGLGAPLMAVFLFAFFFAGLAAKYAWRWTGPVKPKKDPAQAQPPQTGPEEVGKGDL